jgi:hypothetical protein
LKIADEVPVIAFDSPERNDEGGLYAVSLGDLLQQCGVLGQQRATGADALLTDQPRHVILEAQRRLGLIAIQLYHPRQRLDSIQRYINRVLRNAVCARLGANAVKPAGEILRIRARARRRHCDQQRCGGCPNACEPSPRPVQSQSSTAKTISVEDVSATITAATTRLSHMRWPMTGRALQNTRISA